MSGVEPKCVDWRNVSYTFSLSAPLTTMATNPVMVVFVVSTKCFEDTTHQLRG